MGLKIFKIKRKSLSVKVSNEERSEWVSPGTLPTQTHSDLSSPGWIRTRTNSTKNCCATVTPQD